MAGLKTASTSIKKSNGNGNGLILYQYYPSYYCQKVVFALHEKKLKFKSQIVNLFSGEQFEPWFIKLNPKSEVPVLKDGVKIIPDSRRIIDYVEDNFSNGDTPRLMPEKGSIPYQVMERMRDLIDTLPIQLVTFGCLLNPTLTGQVRLSPQEVKIRQSVHVVHDEILTALGEKHKDFRDYYLVKKSNIERQRVAYTNSNEVEKGILDVAFALKEADKILGTHVGAMKDWWLCCEKFTIADISLCVLLNRLYMLGLMDNFFKDNQLPNLQEYYKRAQQRDAFKKTMNQSSSILSTFSTLEKKEQVLVTVGGVVALLAAAGIATFLIQRNK